MRAIVLSGQYKKDLKRARKPRRISGVPHPTGLAVGL